MASISLFGKPGTLRTGGLAWSLALASNWKFVDSSGFTR
jgi:hypothetical protein